MTIKITPCKLEGEVVIPGSKSLTHRALICASLAKGKSIIRNPLFSEDTKATISILEALGVKFEIGVDKIEVTPPKNFVLNGELSCYESGSTLRFLIPLLTLVTDSFKIKTSKRMIDRINTKDLDDLKGLKFRFDDDYIYVSGKLESNLTLSSKITSQWISGILFILPYTNINLKVDTFGSYTQLTLDVLKEFGININYNDGFKVLGSYKESNYTVEIDYSSAAFFIAMGLFNNIRIRNLGNKSNQPDYRILEIINNIDNITVCDMTNTPDIAMLVASIFSVYKGSRRLTGLKKLELKESNRLLAIYEALKNLGADISLVDGDLVINGKDYLEGNTIINSYNDHRVLMSIASISSQIKNPFYLTDKDCVNKSLPNFYDLFTSIGGKYEDCL